MIPRNATVAINPLQWCATEDGWLDWGLAPPWPELMAEVKRAGFDAVHTRVPPDIDPRDYGQIIRDAGLEPAPGTTAFDLPEDGVEIEVTLDSIRMTANAYAELGLNHVFVLAGVHPDAPRARKPAQGTQSDPARLERIAELLARC